MKEPPLIHWLQEVDSTNSEARRRIAELADRSVVAAESQTAGRGQRGNSWSSKPGENLTFSIVLRFDPTEGFQAKDQFSLSQATALGICDHLGASGIPARIKWPNDIYVQDRKICGILIENSLREGLIVHSIIGIGLNVNQREFPPHLPNPTSLFLCDGTQRRIRDELPRLLKSVFARIESIPDSIEELREDYHRRLYRLNHTCDYLDLSDSTLFKGRITGTSENGLLRVECIDGSTKEFAFKEIGFVV